MCGRYVLISKLKKIESQLKAEATVTFEPNYNISPGTEAPIITSADTEKVVLSSFGFTPSFASKKTYIINARAEGDLNKNNLSSFSGKKGILDKPFFKAAIRSKRCIIPANAFIEGSKEKKLNEPYLIHLKKKNSLFVFAGIYDDWLDPNTGNTFSSFAIITCPPNPLIKSVNHHRMPVILKQEDIPIYLNTTTPLHKVSDLLTLFPANEMKAYKISRKIKNPRNNYKELLHPVLEWEEEKNTPNNQTTLF